MAVNSVSGNDDSAARAAQSQRAQKAETQENRVREDDRTREAERSNIDEADDDRPVAKTKSSNDDNLGRNVDISV